MKFSAYTEKDSIFVFLKNKTYITENKRGSQASVPKINRVSRSKPEHITCDDFIEIKEGIKAQSICQGDEIFLHRVSDGKMEKGKAMVAKARDRIF